LKWSLHHFVGFLENEQRVQRAFGGLTTALGNIAKALDWELNHIMKVMNTLSLLNLLHHCYYLNC
jgi:hypothetical protein